MGHCLMLPAPPPDTVQAVPQSAAVMRMFSSDDDESARASAHVLLGRLRSGCQLTNRSGSPL